MTPRSGTLPKKYNYFISPWVSLEGDDVHKNLDDVPAATDVPTDDAKVEDPEELLSLCLMQCTLEPLLNDGSNVPLNHC